MNITRTSIVAIAVFFISGTALSADDTKASVDAPPQAVPKPQNLRRVVEYETAVQFLVDAAWKPKQHPTDGAAFALEGEIPTTVKVHYPPPDQKTQPTAEAVREDDLKAARKKPEWKKEKKKVVDSTWTNPELQGGITVISSGVEATRDKKNLLIRNFYLTSPVKGVVTVNCEQPVGTAGAEDPCATFLKSAKIVPAEERERQKAAQAMMNRLWANAKKDDVSCSVVNEENKEFRSFYPNAKLQSIPRFEWLNTIMLATMFSKMDKMTPDQLKAFLALQKEFPGLLKSLEDQCLANPEMSYGDAAGVVFKTSKPAPK